jgi:hypothetical protein
MFRILSVFALALFTQYTLIAQAYNPLFPPNTYQNQDNPNYWKNKMPFEGYWQQDVHYTIKADINEKTDIISATETLIYTNNSPDDLYFVYFHLYQNAFQPESYCHQLHELNKFDIEYGKYEENKKGTEIERIQSNGQNLRTELDNTVLKVYLTNPLKSGQSITFDIQFKTYFDTGSIRRRMKTFKSYGFKHFDGVHWYPRISVYDRKMGWDTDQHLTREFYGDFGAFDVELTFANHFIVDATGNLINRTEVLPDDLRQKLDLKNFKDKPWGEKPSIIIPYDSTIRKTWKFHAENVHDFAFTADPTYRIGETIWNGVSCIALAQEPHASGWQNAADYTAQIIKTFSEEIGMYTYHKMIVADAKDGMEYPMLTLDGGKDPGYRDLLVHEVGHNWFYGQVGNNETYRAFLDEGFTQYLTSMGLEKIDGKVLVEENDKSGYKRAFRKEKLVRDDEVYINYLMDAIREQDAPLNTHSDQFGNALRHGGGYRNVYSKTATMLYNLEYVLGDELFKNALKHYFAQWKIAHPYPEDFRNSIINYTKVDLNWFFDQWLETTKSIDFKVNCVKKGSDQDQYTISFKRKNEMQMPLDFQVLANDGKKYNFHIPNTWFEKKTNATILPRWIGWGKLNNVYEARVIIPSGIHAVHIDTSMRLADINRLDNKTCQKIDWSLDHKIKNMPNIHQYEANVRPELWYNAFDGFKVGAHLNGHYMKYLHNLDASAWYNTGILQQKKYVNESTKNEFNVFSYRLNYLTSTNKILKKSTFQFSSKYLDGLIGNSIAFNIPTRNEKGIFAIEAKSMYRPNATDLIYLMYPLEWNAGQWNNIVNVSYQHQYKYVKGQGMIRVGLKSSSMLSDYDYAALYLESTNHTDYEKITFKSRLFAQYGVGSFWAPESKLFLAGANPEELMENKFMRSVGFTDRNWLGYSAQTNHLHYGGGLNLRGYAGYLALEQSSDSTVIYNTYRGQSGAALNLELEFNRLIPFKIKALKNVFDFKTYLFGDAGLINIEQKSSLGLSNLRMDAGLGAALTIKKFGPLETVHPLTLRADFPLFLSHVPAVEVDNIKFRWVVGISRAF